MTNIAAVTNAGIKSGFAYAEVLVAVVILMIGLQPAMDALQSGTKASRVSSQSADLALRVSSQIEELLAQPFGALQAAVAGSATPSTYSDDSGTANRRLVYISAWDIDNLDADNNGFTGTDPDVLWLRVEIEDAPLFALETLTVP